MANKKVLNVKLKGFLNSISESEDIKVELDDNATLTDLIMHLKSSLIQQFAYSSISDGYKFNIDDIMIFENKQIVENEQWKTHISKDGSSIWIIPFFSGG